MTCGTVPQAFRTATVMPKMTYGGSGGCATRGARPCVKIPAAGEPGTLCESPYGTVSLQVCEELGSITAVQDLGDWYSLMRLCEPAYTRSFASSSMLGPAKGCRDPLALLDRWHQSQYVGSKQADDGIMHWQLIVGATGDKPW